MKVADNISRGTHKCDWVKLEHKATYTIAPRCPQGCSQGNYRVHIEYMPQGQNALRVIARVFQSLFARGDELPQGSG